MELVGREVRKSFPGFGDYRGVVKSYDAEAGYFKIKYDDGDSEELDLNEVVEILKAKEDLSLSSCGRPRKRRDVSTSGMFSRAFFEERNGELNTGNGNLLDNRARDVAAKEIARIFGEDSEGECCAGTPEEAHFTVGKQIEIQEGNSITEGWEGVELEEPLGDNCGKDLGSSVNVLAEFVYWAGEDASEQGRNKRPRVTQGKPGEEVRLRRSARQTNTETYIYHMPNGKYSLEMMALQDHKMEDLSNFNNCMLDEKFNEIASHDFKPELPPSSSDLDVDGLPLLDLFSVYTCLRSFSRLMFLSPFSLKPFIASLKCKHVNNLIDSIHLSILQTLKRHLELLAEEGSQSAITCLRGLNWELLDIVTWPVYLSEYLLLHGSSRSLDFKVPNLKLLSTEYYVHPPEVKLEILRCLCDDIIEVDTVRSELDRRIIMSDPESDPKHAMSVERSKNVSSMAAFNTSDGNSDECCLCQMDGILICCDGCPAAFHSKCVGVATECLPEGDWFCPECMADKYDGLLKLVKKLSGEELLGVDPHGRMYFGSCGYLLVCESNGLEASYYYYNREDSTTVIEVLKSSHSSYSRLTIAISKYLNITFDAFHNTLSTEIFNVYAVENAQELADLCLSEKPRKDTTFIKKLKGNDTSPDNDSLTVSTALDHRDLDHLVVTNLPNEGSITSNKTNSSVLTHENPVGQDKTDELIHNNATNPSTETGSHQLLMDPDAYINSYQLGRIAYSIYAESLRRPPESDHNDSKRPQEDSQSAKLEAISRKANRVRRFSYDKLSVGVEKEKCGWCCACRSSDDGNNCMFVVAGEKHLQNSKNRSIDSSIGKIKRNHIMLVIPHILSIEERLSGFLSGPWCKSQYSKNWRKAVMNASDVASLKHLLLILESNLRRVVLSPDWMKASDSHTLRSVSHVSNISVHMSSNSIGGRKQAKHICSEAESGSASNDVTGLRTYWWRGGRVSQRISQCKMLPRSLASKGARQAGCNKLPGLFYSDGLELAKRSKCVVWRASVELSKNVAQLVYQVKDLDFHIRWAELSNAYLFSQSLKDSKKLPKPLKKVMICKKSIEGTIVKYLLDFGKKEAIPAIVEKNGVLLSGCTDGRKKYWLNESHVPLGLIKIFEEKNIALVSKKSDSDVPFERERKRNLNTPKSTPKRSRDLASVILKKQEQIEVKNILCAHCDKDVDVRQAVKCQYCSGFLHKKHFRVSKGAMKTMYACGRCDVKSLVKRKAKSNGLQKGLAKEKAHGDELDKSKVKKQPQPTKTSKTSSRVRAQGHKSKWNCTKRSKRKQTSLTNLSKKRKVINVKRKLKNKRKQSSLKKHNDCRRFLSNEISIRKRKRTVVHHSFWFNGLLQTRKTDDKRANEFKETNVILPLEEKEPHLMPECSLCNEKYNNSTIYISCQNCKGWFHGDIFGLTTESVRKIIGFKCHKCLMRNIPKCAFVKDVFSDETFHKRSDFVRKFADEKN